MTGVCFAYIMRYKELNIEKEKGNGSSANKGRQPNSLLINQPKPQSQKVPEVKKLGQESTTTSESADVLQTPPKSNQQSSIVEEFKNSDPVVQQLQDQLDQVVLEQKQPASLDPVKAQSQKSPAQLKRAPVDLAIDFAVKFENKVMFYPNDLTKLYHFDPNW